MLVTYFCQIDGVGGTNIFFCDWTRGSRLLLKMCSRCREFSFATIIHGIWARRFASHLRFIKDKLEQIVKKLIHFQKINVFITQGIVI